MMFELSNSTQWSVGFLFASGAIVITADDKVLARAFCGHFIKSTDNIDLIFKLSKLFNNMQEETTKEEASSRRWPTFKRFGEPRLVKVFSIEHDLASSKFQIAMSISSSSSSSSSFSPGPGSVQKSISMSR